MNNYEAKQEAKRERFEELADKNRRESESLHDRAHRMASVIPFGQPVLVGHHSEGRDRRYRSRIQNTYGKSFEAQEKADYYARRAASVGTAGIASEDPDATEKLSDKLAKLETLQERMRAANKVVKRKKLADAEKIAQLTEQGFSPEAAAELLKPDFCGRIGFPDYALTNNNANIRRIKGRIEHLARVQSQPETEQENESTGIRLEDSPSDNRVRLFFPGKPSEEIRTKLKSNGFRWSPTIGAWQAYRNYHSMELAKTFV